MRAVLVGSICALLVLRLCQKVLEYQFIQLAGQPANSSSGAGSEGGASTLTRFISWVYTCRYLLPVFGGLLACQLGHVRVLQLGGCVMLVSTAIAAAAIWQGQWHAGGSGLGLAASLLMLVYNGLVMPSVMHGILAKPTSLRHRTVLCAIIYLSSAAGLYVGIGVSKLNGGVAQRTGYAVACVAIAIAFCAVAFLLLPRLEAALARAAEQQQQQQQEEEEQEEEEEVEEEVEDVQAPPNSASKLVLPTMNRLQRCCTVFGALILFLAGLCDDRSSVFKAGAELLLNVTGGGGGGSGGTGGSDARETPTSTVLAVGLVATNAALVAAACLRRRSRLPVKPRLIAGVALEAGLEAGLALVCSSVGVGRIASETAVTAVFAAASLVDAVAAALAMVAVYELMDGFELDEARPLIIGVMLTVWGFATVASRLLVVVCESLPPDRPVLLPPRTGQPTLMYAYHLALLALLLCCLVYCRLFAFPAADSLTVSYAREEGGGTQQRRRLRRLDVGAGDDVEEDDNDEARPLLPGRR